MDRLTKKLILGGVILSAFLALNANAAQISFETGNSTVSVGDTVVLRVRLNTTGSSINAVDLGILYPKILRVKTISKAGSFIQLWVKEPAYTSDTILLSGGAPGGVNSENSTIATITFEAAAVGDGALGLSPASAVLLNDGSGSEAQVSLQTPTIHVVPRKSGQSNKTVGVDIGAKESKIDFSAPQPFDVLIGSDARLFGGKYFVSFSTFDSGSGIDHYTIKEGNGSYVIARSPYLLSDQNLHSVIRVRAYDTAGNYREEVYPGVFKRIWWWITDHLHL